MTQVRSATGDKENLIDIASESASGRAETTAGHIHDMRSARLRTSLFKTAMGPAIGNQLQKQDRADGIPVYNTSPTGRASDGGATAICEQPVLLTIQGGGGRPGPGRRGGEWGQGWFCFGFGS